MSGAPCDFGQRPKSGLTPSLVITVVNGVPAKWGLSYEANGECMKRFQVHDGLGMRMLEENGVSVAVLSRRGLPALQWRLAEIGIMLYQRGVIDKYSASLA